MTTVKNIYKLLADFAPVKYKEDFDNVGLLVGDGEQNVSKVLVALDVTLEVAKEAERIGAELIVAHHPVFFSVKSVTEDDPTGRLIRYLIRANISAISMHTNLDKTNGGVNDMLAAALGIEVKGPIVIDGLDDNGIPYGLGRIGRLQKDWTMEEFVPYVAQKLGCKGIRFRDAGRPVRKVAVGGGTCGDYIPDVIAAGCDTFVTADLKYNMFLSAKDKGINLIDAGHYPTENVVCAKLEDVISAEFPEIVVARSEVHEEHVGYWMP